MKKYFSIYKPFLLFLGTFFLTYIVLSLLYDYYLSSFGVDGLDSITLKVAQNTQQVLQWFEPNSVRIEESGTNYVKLWYHQKGIARIIEGCNAISVIILFIAFVVAFSGKLKTTLLFIFGGSLLIYILNIFRIAALCVLLYHFPEYGSLLHDIIFPLFIYGVVFLLWVIWVTNFSKYAKNTIQS